MKATLFSQNENQPVVSECRDGCSMGYLKAFLWNRSSDMRVVAADMGAGEMVIPGLKWSGVELVICIGNAADAELGAPPLVGGDLHGFSILDEIMHIYIYLYIKRRIDI